MVARSRLAQLEDGIDRLHAARVLPPFVRHLQTLTTDELKALEAQFERLAEATNRKDSPYG